MYDNLKGKKLLVLGATADEVPIVRRAQELGIHTIVTDYNTDHIKSPAKDVADEVWYESWADLDILEEKCREAGVDGVIAGYSEIRVDCMLQLAGRLGLPAYITEDQLEITRNKIIFKDTCRKYGVPVIREYASVDQVDEYPVIVKPTDRAGSIGVGIANNYQELLKAYDYAMEKSLEGKVIIEKYMNRATEFDAHYLIQEGEITLLTVDRIVDAALNKAEGKVIQSAWIHPEKTKSIMLETVDLNLRKMIQGMGCKNGCIFFSGFIDENLDYSFFECGYRLWGEQEYEYHARRGLPNYLDVFILSALGENTGKLEIRPNGNPDLRCIEISVYVRGGVITELSGLDQIEAMEDCTVCIPCAYIGQECEGDKAILTKAALIGFASESLETLISDVEEMYRLLCVLDEKGESMIYDIVSADTIRREAL